MRLDCPSREWVGFLDPSQYILAHVIIDSGNLTNAKGTKRAVSNIPFGSAVVKYHRKGIVPHSLDLLSTVLNHHTSNSGQMGLLQSKESRGTVDNKLNTPVRTPVITAWTIDS